MGRPDGVSCKKECKQGTLRLKATNKELRVGRRSINRIGIYGGGAWGTALATAAARAGNNVVIWAREPEVVTTINQSHENKLFLPGVQLDDKIRASDDPAALVTCEAILLAVPTQHMRLALDNLRVAAGIGWPHDLPLIICSKGIEIRSGHLLSEVISDMMPENPVTILSGPTFASEVARDLPCALTLAAADVAVRDSLIEMLAMPRFRLYGSDDVAGAQVGGAVKNVIAIATGIVHGLGLGENARAAVITRGLAEIVRFARSYDADPATLMGLSGLGDLMLTCSSLQSRNMSLGAELASGKTFEEIMEERQTVAEGAHTAKALAGLAEERGLDMPITQAVAAILHQGANVSDVMKSLMERPFTDELTP